MLHAGLRGTRPGRHLQAQVGDIGLMGGPAKLDGKAVEGVRIMVRHGTRPLAKCRHVNIRPEDHHAAKSIYQVARAIVAKANLALCGN